MKLKCKDCKKKVEITHRTRKSGSSKAKDLIATLFCPECGSHKIELTLNDIVEVLDLPLKGEV